MGTKGEGSGSGAAARAPAGGAAVLQWALWRTSSCSGVGQGLQLQRALLEQSPPAPQVVAAVAAAAEAAAAAAAGRRLVPAGRRRRRRVRSVPRIRARGTRRRGSTRRRRSGDGQAAGRRVSRAAVVVGAASSLVVVRPGGPILLLLRGGGPSHPRCHHGKSRRCRRHLRGSSSAEPTERCCFGPRRERWCNGHRVTTCGSGSGHNSCVAVTPPHPPIRSAAGLCPTARRGPLWASSLPQATDGLGGRIPAGVKRSR